jgi:hypothetical protein
MEMLPKPSELGLLSPDTDMVDEWRVLEHFSGSQQAELQLLRNATNDPVFGATSYACCLPCQF